MGAVSEEQPADKPRVGIQLAEGQGRKGAGSGLESESSFHPILRLDFGP